MKIERTNLFMWILLSTFVCGVQGATAPEQIMLSHGATPTSVLVSWLSDTSDGSVYFGTSATKLATEVKGDPGVTYSFVSNFSRSFTYTSKYIHHVTLEKLSPDSIYYYKIISGDDVDLSGSVSSNVFKFTSAPAVGSRSTFAISVMGDLGQTNNSNATIHQAIASFEEFGVVSAIIVGDMSYADSAWQPRVWNNFQTNQTRWDSWGRLIQPLAAQTPLMVCPGNHEVEQQGPPPATQTQFLAYDKRFAMPAKATGATEGNQYYSYEIGSVHVIMMNSYCAYNQTSLQYKWFTEDLAKVDRTKTPWIVVNMHAPFYNSNRKHHNEAEEVGMRKVYEDQLLFAQVDVIFSGHVHSYERMHNVMHNKTNLVNGLLYINIGDGGNREGHAGPYLQMPEWSAYREDQFGHGLLRIDNATHMDWQWHRVNNSVVVGDHVSIIKKHSIGLPSEGAVAVPHGRTPQEYLYSQEKIDGFKHRLNVEKEV